MMRGIKMKKQILVLCLFILFANELIPQQNDLLQNSDSAQKREKVYRYCYVIKSKDWYAKQEKLWQEEIFKNPQNEDAWYNYYFASRYASTELDEKKRKQHLDEIIDEIKKVIPGSYLYPYLRYYNGDYKIDYLKNAYQIKPDCADLYWDFILYYEINGTDLQKKEFCKKLYLSKDIISSLYDYNFNVLNSTEKNSILFSNGDNDTYPIWILQEVKDIRNDVTLLNVHTVFMLRDYLKRKLDERGIEINVENLSKEDIALFFKQLISSIKKKYPEISIHIAPTVYDEYKKYINDKLYVTGPVYTYNENQLDNLALIKRNLEQNLRLDYLEYDWYNEQHVSQPLIERCNLNYIPSFIELAKMYKSKGDKNLSNYWKDKAIRLAKKINDEELIKRVKKMEW
jgi:hypothetical protein